MNPIYLSLTPRDPLIARDGRPFGAGQGNRMRGLPWPLPSVVAGSFRTALVKATSDLDFAGDMPKRLLDIEVGGVFPVHNGELYLPAPSNALAEPAKNGTGIKIIYRVMPQELKDGGCDFPESLPLQPVMLPPKIEDFKPADLPAWWPLTKYVEWLTPRKEPFDSAWLTKEFLHAANQEIRDHVCLDAERGAAAESQLFATTGLNVSYLPRFYVNGSDEETRAKSFADRFAEIKLSARVTISESGFEHVSMKTWHPLGGERRLVHWQANGEASLWACPDKVREELASPTRICMVLATPAILSGGWKPGWLKNGLEGEIHGVKLKLVGVSNGRWKAVSGWSLANINNKGELDPTGKPGPKPVRRIVPAGSVYFFTTTSNAASLADHWLQSVSDAEQEQRDGFGLAVWGTW